MIQSFLPMHLLILIAFPSSYALHFHQ